MPDASWTIVLRLRDGSLRTVRVLEARNEFHAVSKAIKRAEKRRRLRNVISVVSTTQEEVHDHP